MNPEPPNNSGAQKIVKTCAAVIIMIIAAVFVLIFWWWFTPPQMVVEADAGFKKAKQTIDPEQLRAWALQEIKTHSGKYASIPEAEVPKYIQNLYSNPPESVWVDGSCVNILWGGGFFGWGFYIGDTNKVMPLISDNREYPYNFEWKPGIYYTRETRRKLQ